MPRIIFDSTFEQDISELYEQEFTFFNTSKYLSDKLYDVLPSLLYTEMFIILNNMISMPIHLYRYFDIQNTDIRKISPILTLTKNDNSLNITNNHVHSSTISIYNMYKGSFSNTRNAYHKIENLDIPIMDINLKKYILYTSDFCIDKDKILRINEIDHDIKTKIKIMGNKITIDDIPYNKYKTINYKLVLNTILLQQHYQHLGTHILCTYGYNLLMSCNINNVVSNNCIIHTILEYGYDIRNITEGFGKYTIFNFSKNNNSYLINSIQSVNIIRMLENIHLKLHDNLLDNELHNKITRNVYSIYINVCKQYLDQNTIDKISKKINKTSNVSFNIIVNLLFLLTYYHNRTHYTLIYSPIKNISSQGLLNQTFYGIQNSKKNSLLKKIQKDISAISIIDSKLIGNSHI